MPEIVTIARRVGSGAGRGLFANCRRRRVRARELGRGRPVSERRDLAQARARSGEATPATAPRIGEATGLGKPSWVARCAGMAGTPPRLSPQRSVPATWRDGGVADGSTSRSLRRASTEAGRTSGLNALDVPVHLEDVLVGQGAALGQPQLAFLVADRPSEGMDAALDETLAHPLRFVHHRLG